MITLYIITLNGRRAIWGTYSTVNNAARRGQQLLSRNLIADYAITTPDGVLCPIRPEPRKVLPKEPTYV